ncbi:MAG TPA: ABC transporter substrate-binding protein [Candidatus Paceibacterota bacterium]|nr:ABC transporter substrate-binding protein [Candidatus Paceibacterota bacterium]
MTTFFSFLKTHKVPPREALQRVLRRPLTWYGVVLYGLVGSIAVVTYLLVLHINNRLLITIPDAGGILTEGMIGAPHLINPITATTETDRDIVALVYSGLMKKNSDGSLTPDLAQTYNISPDGRTYTFTLKPNLKWSDGKPLESADVAFTAQKLADSALSAHPLWQSVTVSTPDPHTIIFTLSAPNQDFLEATTVGILPAHLWQGVADSDFDTVTTNMTPVGSGPYRVTTIAYQDSVPAFMYLKRNPHYVLEHPYIERYTLAFFANQEELLDALKGGAVTMTFAATPSTATAFAHPEVHIQKVASTNVVGLFHRQSDTTINDALLSVIGQSIDRSALLAIVEDGYGILPDETTPSLSVADSTATLQSLGFTENNGILQKKGVPVTFSIAVENDPELLLAAYTFAGQLQNLGIDASIKAFDKGTFQDALQTNAYPFFIGDIHGNDIPSGYTVALQFYTKAYPFIATPTLHATIPPVLKEPWDRYADVTSWYVRTDRVWKIFSHSL